MKRHPIKGIASAHLWLKYSLGTTVRDVEQFAENFDEVSSALTLLSMREIVRYGMSYETTSIFGEPISVYVTSKVSVTPRYINQLQAFNRKAGTFGLAVSTENFWDIIPYSFVVDWFFSIGTLLEKVDYATHTNGSNYDLNYRTTGAKVCIPLTSDIMPGHSLNFEGVELTAYSRQVFSHFPKNEFSFGSTNPTRHFFDGLALIVSR
jgi:hypothetical protein